MYADVWGTLGTTEMDREETLVDLVERLEKAVGRLERRLDGDAELGAIGLNQRVAKLATDVETLLEREPIPILFMTGVVLFVAAFGLIVRELRDFVALPTLPALALSALLLALSMVFFYAGLGWARKWFR